MRLLGAALAILTARWPPWAQCPAVRARVPNEKDARAEGGRKPCGSQNSLVLLRIHQIRLALGIRPRTGTARGVVRNGHLREQRALP